MLVRESRLLGVGRAVLSACARYRAAPDAGLRSRG
nr:MAG TPA: hypothetical protein [Caudoviricetes sp.]